MAKSISEILSLIESVSDAEDASGVASRFVDQLAEPKGTQALVERLDERRELLGRWKGLAHLCEQVRVRESAAIRGQLEAATQAVLAAEGLEALLEVVKEHPLVFTGAFLHSLVQFQQQASQKGDEFEARLVQNRLGHLQLIQLAQMSNFELTKKNLLELSFTLVEAASFGDVLDLVLDHPIVLADAFDTVFNELMESAKATGEARLEKVARLRVAVFRALRSVVETVVAKRPAEGGPASAVEALNQAVDAEQFLLTVARFPFVLGEDFGVIIAREMANARDENDTQAVAGLERRLGHLNRIGSIVAKLTGHPVGQEEPHSSAGDNGKPETEEDES